LLHIFDTKDIDELVAAQGEWDIRHRPTDTGAFHGRLMLGRVGGIRVDLETWSTPLEIVGSAPRNGLSLSLPLGESASYVSRGCEVKQNQIDVFAAGTEVFAQTSPGSALISCTLPLDALGWQSSSGLETLKRANDSPHAVLSCQPEAVTELRQWLMNLLKWSGREDITIEGERSLLADTLLLAERLLSDISDENGSNPLPASRLARLARDYMIDRLDQPPSIREICLALSTSERSLHSAFKRTYGVSPKRFLKARRLLAAREALKSPNVEGCINEVAFDLGFWDLGRFARDYRIMFEEYPSETLRRR